MKVALHCPDNTKPSMIEHDASDAAVSAILNQYGWPVAFMLRTLNCHETYYPAIEKEATAVIEAVRKWSHFLSGQHFTIVTDQKSVAFIMDNHRQSKIKNDKIQGWCLELAIFCYDICYRLRHYNVVTDTLSHAYCNVIFSTSLKKLHDVLCHPRIIRLLHYVHSKNMPFSTEGKEVF